jgi:FKBP-type peptidyl-prolyl cis-trans isomerase FkpA
MQLLPLLLVVMLALSCSKDETQYRDEIINYLVRKEYNYRDTLGIWIAVQDPGTFEKPSESSTVTIEYSAQYLDDTIFDTSGTVPSELKLSSAVPGLRNGIKLLGKNARAIIIIPPDQAYGNNPPWGVRKNAILIYNIHLLDFR